MQQSQANFSQRFGGNPGGIGSPQSTSTGKPTKALEAAKAVAEARMAKIKQLVEKHFPPEAPSESQLVGVWFEGRLCKTKKTGANSLAKSLS